MLFILIMKILSAIIGLALIFPVHTLATSGCCSGHDGVNCGAGAPSNGKVVCNDGWTGSSCSYSTSCGGSVSAPVNTPAPTPKPVIITPTIKPTPTPVKIPSPIPKPSVTPSPEPSKLPDPTPAQAVAQLESPTPSSEPKQSSPVTGSDVAIVLGVFGAMGWGGYKLVRKIISKFTA